jgi:ATP-dependent protease ClpP protease subunit
MTIKFNGVIGWDITAKSFAESLPKNNEPVDIHVNSDGGDVIEAFAIYNAIKDYKGEVVITIDAIAASAAAYLIFAADKIKVYDNSIIMLHRSWICARGNAVKLREMAALLDSLDNIMAADYAAMTGKEKAAALAEMEKDIWLTGADAIAAHGINCERIDYESAEENVKIDEAQARTRYEAMVEKIKAANKPVFNTEILALLKKEPAGSAGRRAKAMTKEELLKLLESDEELKKSVLEWAREQAEAEPEPEAGGDPPPEGEPEKKDPPKSGDPKKEPPAENKAAAERRRVAQILALAGGVMTARAEAAITNGTSAADFMVGEKIAEQKALAQGGSNADELGRPSTPKTFAELGGKKTDGPNAVITDDGTLRTMAKGM